jgi:glycosyltransferase involved in cell wall biosynthesis
MPRTATAMKRPSGPARSHRKPQAASRPMKVLLISVFHPELVRGGAQQICYELFKAMKARADVEPVLLAAVDPSFAAFYKAGACITGFDGRDGEFLYLSRNYDYWWHKVSAPEMLEAFAEFLRTLRPDVIHFHHFLLVGLDLLTLARRVLPDARIVFTLHEFLAICAADGHMLRTSDKSLCTRASAVRCHQCIPERGPEQFFMRELWVKRHFSVVDAFTTPSRFMIEHYVSWGLDRAAISHVTNGQPDYSLGAAPSQPRRMHNRFGFFGQMVDNKGVWVILHAVMHLRAEGFTAFSVEINGDNLRYASAERRAEIEAFRKAEEERPFEERIVFFNGPYHTEQLAPRMMRVDWCIVPSVWWEIFGLVISEAWMFRRPVIASNVGGPAERIRHEVDGLLFDVADAHSLAQTMRRAATEDRLWEQLAEGIRPWAGTDAMTDGYMEVYRGEIGTR